jgi:hypothetical protein
VRFRGSPLLAGALAAACLPPIAAAQSVRVTGSTSVRYLEVRPLLRDSFPETEAEGNGLLRQTPEGRFVRCVPGEPVCRGTRAGERVSTVPAVQDLELSAWGFGQGLRVFSHLRGRAGWGKRADLWPRAERPLDVLTAYGELDRDRYRVRIGRQWTTSGLGFYNFDGVTLGLRASGKLEVDTYAGRSLVRGLNEARGGGALEAVEALAPEDPGVVLGVQARYRASPGFAAGVLYHIDLRSDRAGIYSELARTDLVLRSGSWAVETSLEADVVSAGLNEARLVARTPLGGHARMQGEIRRYRPYFELWTIWGAFSPVGFDEGRVALTWAPRGGALLVRGEAAYRSYDASVMETSVDPLRTDGWGFTGRTSWSPAREWRLEGGAGVDTGFGGTRRDAHVSLSRQFGPRGAISARTLAFQRVYELRLEEGTVVGAGADGWLRLSHRSRGSGGLTMYRHVEGAKSPESDWNQLRGTLRVQWTVGSEPGLAGSGGGSR